MRCRGTVKLKTDRVLVVYLDDDTMVGEEDVVTIGTDAGVDSVTRVEWDDGIHDCDPRPEGLYGRRMCQRINGIWYVMETFDGHAGMIDKLKKVAYCPDCGKKLEEAI